MAAFSVSPLGLYYNLLINCNLILFGPNREHMGNPGVTYAKKLYFICQNSKFGNFLFKFCFYSTDNLGNSASIIIVYMTRT